MIGWDKSIELNLPKAEQKEMFPHYDFLAEKKNYPAEEKYQIIRGINFAKDIVTAGYPID